MSANAVILAYTLLTAYGTWRIRNLWWALAVFAPFAFLTAWIGEQPAWTSLALMVLGRFVSWERERPARARRIATVAPQVRVG